jgi:hypothetical protein
MKKKRICEILLDAGIITPFMAQHALQAKERWGEKTGQIMIRLGYIDEETLIYVLSVQHSVPTVNLDRTDIPSRALKALPRDIVVQYRILPIDVTQSKLKIAYCEVSDMSILSDLSYTISFKIEKYLTTTALLIKYLKLHFDVDDGLSNPPSESLSNEHLKMMLKQRVGGRHGPSADDAFESILGKTFAPEEIEFIVRASLVDLSADVGHLGNFSGQPQIGEIQAIKLKTDFLVSVLRKRGVSASVDIIRR